jgi:hypothetical protein
MPCCAMPLYLGWHSSGESTDYALLLLAQKTPSFWEKYPVLFYLRNNII